MSDFDLQALCDSALQALLCDAAAGLGGALMGAVVLFGLMWLADFP